MSSRVTNSSTGPNLVVAFNSHATDIEALQASLLALTSANYVPPVGAYTAPTASARFLFSARGTPWTTMTRIMQLTAGSTAQTLYSAGKWGTNSFYTVAFNGTNTEVRRFAITSGGTITLVATVTLVASQISTGKICVLPVSDTVLRVVYYNGTSFFGAQITYDGVSTLTLATAGTYALNYLTFMQQHKGWLVGSASMGVPGYSNTSGGLIVDRANTLVAWNGDLSARAPIAAFASEWLGGGYEIRVSPVNVPIDNNARMMVELCLWSDIGILHLAQIKIPGRIMGGASCPTIIPLSNSLVAIFAQDSTGGQFVVLCTVNLSTNTLGYVGTYTAGNFATTMGWTTNYGLNKQEMNFDALNMYVRKNITTPTGQKLGRCVYNSAAAAGSEFTSDSANDITYSAGAGIAGITSITDQFIWQQFADIAVAVSAVTATTSQMAAESFTMT